MSNIVKRTLDFFEMFAEQGRPLSLSEISKLLDIPISSCHDVLQSLQDRGYIYELGSRVGFYPTARLQQMAAEIAEHDPVILRAELKLRALRDRFDESVSLAKVTGEQATYLMVFEPSHSLRFLVRVGETNRSHYATSAGKAVLGTLEPSRREALIKRLKLTPMTDRTLRSKAELKRDIAVSMARGWYLNREESVPTATTVSAHFVWNRAVFIVTVAGPSFRMEPELDEVVRALQETCGALASPQGAPVIQPGLGRPRQPASRAPKSRSSSPR